MIVYADQGRLDPQTNELATTSHDLRFSRSNHYYLA